MAGSSGSATHEIYAVKYGEYVGNRGHYFYGSAADPHEAPVPIDYFVWLIRGPEGDIVVDVGFRHESGTRRGRTYLRDPAAGLAALGVDCATVPLVILSHFHYDHIGDLTPFSAARFVVQDREIAFWTGRYANRREFRKSWRSTMSSRSCRPATTGGCTSWTVTPRSSRASPCTWWAGTAPGCRS